jgi:hypothetical protein
MYVSKTLVVYDESEIAQFENDRANRDWWGDLVSRADEVKE